MTEYTVRYSANGRMVDEYHYTRESAWSAFNYSVNRCKKVELYEDGKLIAAHYER